MPGNEGYFGEGQRHTIGWDAPLAEDHPRIRFGKVRRLLALMARRRFSQWRIWSKDLERGRIGGWLCCGRRRRAGKSQMKFQECECSAFVSPRRSSGEGRIEGSSLRREREYIHEAKKIPRAQAALDSEWKKPRDMTCWIAGSVMEHDEVRRSALLSGKTGHFGRAFPLCVESIASFRRAVFEGSFAPGQNSNVVVFEELALVRLYLRL